MVLSDKDLIEAAESFEVLRFFPAGSAGARREIVKLLESMVDTKEHLDWLVRTMVNKVGEWHGSAELRGIYCTRFKPRDGIEGDCSIAGFIASDSEASYAQEQANVSARRNAKLPSAAAVNNPRLKPEAF